MTEHVAWLEHEPAAAIPRHRHGCLDLGGAMSDDPQRKVFTTTRVEYWVPCHWRDGAYWTELMKAIQWATNELRKAGRVAADGEPASDQLTIHPHDEHVIVRYEVDAPATQVSHDR
jgi:hypothetical protein